MEELVEWIFLGCLLWGFASLVRTTFAYLATQLDNVKIRGADRRVRRRERLHQELEKRRRQELELFHKRRSAEAAAAREKRIKVLSLNLQQALEQLPQSRDFRRAASIAARCREVSLEFRRQQYRRFRPLLEEHVAVCLRRRIDRKQLTDSLADLLQQLGVARFEADYIVDAAALSLKEQVAPRRTPDFAAQLQDELREHQRRVNAIKSLPDNPETLEQMLEIEHRRHSEVLVRLTAGERSGKDEVVTL